MFTHQGGRTSVLHRGLRESDRAGHQWHLAGLGVRHLHGQTACLHLRIDKHLGQTIDGTAGHGTGLQLSNPLGRGAGDRDLVQQRDEFGTVFHPCTVGGKARIGRQFGPSGHLAEAGKLTVVADGQDHVAIRRGKILIRNDAGVRIAHPSRAVAGRQIVHGLVGQTGHLHVQQRHVDVLALTALLAPGQRRQHGIGGIQAGQDVGQRHAHFHGASTRFSIRPASDAHQPAQPLNQEIIAGAWRIGTILPETGNGAIHQPRIDGLQAVVVQSVLLQATQLEVLQYHVGLRCQPTHDVLAFRMSDIDRNGALVPVGAQIIGSYRSILPLIILDPWRPPAPGIVARPRALHLDDIRPQVRQNLPRPRTGQNARQV